MADYQRRTVRSASGVKAGRVLQHNVEEGLIVVEWRYGERSDFTTEDFFETRDGSLQLVD